MLSSLTFRFASFLGVILGGLAVVLAGLLAAQGTCGERICRTVDGKAFPARLQRITNTQQFVFATDAGEQALKLEELTTWGALRDTTDGTQVVLADGSVIVADAVRLEGDSLVVQTQRFGEPKGFSIAGTSRLPVRSLKAIVFRVPISPAKRDELLKDIHGADGNEDQLWLANGDVLRGTVTRLQPAQREDDRTGPMTVGINTAAGAVEIEPKTPQGRLREKVRALVFNPLLAREVPAAKPAVLVGLEDGSRLWVKRFQSDGERIHFELHGGVELTSYPDEDIVRRINALQAFPDSVRYLSSLRPIDYRHTPLLNRTWQLGVNESVAGGRLRSAGNLYLRGIGMHARSRVVYRLDRPYRRFEAELAVDESAGAKGSVQFIVATIDGREVKQLYPDPAESEPRIIRGGEAPRPIAVDITDRSNLVLFVTEADHGTQLDRANWLNARLIQ